MIRWAIYKTLVLPLYICEIVVEFKSVYSCFKKKYFSEFDTISMPFILSLCFFLIV